MQYPPISEICNYTMLPRKVFLAMRIANVIAHMTVVILGLYTRTKKFFMQLTNLTNLLSFAFSISVLTMTLMFKEPPTKRSRRAFIAQQLAQTSLPMHVVATTVFWLFIWKTANKTHGWPDYIYLTFAHGVTLVLTLVDSIFMMVQFSRKSLVFVMSYLGGYLVVVFVVFRLTGFAIYHFADYKNPANWLALLGCTVMTVASNELVMLMVKLGRKLVRWELKQENSKSE